MLYTYRNTRTGAEISVPVPVFGEWELVEPKKDAEPVAEEKPKKKRTVKKK